MQRDLWARPQLHDVAASLPRSSRSEQSERDNPSEKKVHYRRHTAVGSYKYRWNQPPRL